MVANKLHGRTKFPSLLGGELILAFLLALFLNLPHLFAQSQAYHIGDVITNPDGSKGVVFWLAPDGSGGWMCALNDVSGTYKWSTQNVNISGFPALPTPSTLTWQAYSTVTADTAGYEHTQRLRAAGNASTYPAAYAVDFAHGWYLPAIGQLLKLYAQQATISAALVANGGSEISRTNHYWSSTYAATSSAYYLYNPSGYWGTPSKSTAYSVRPVRSFTCRHIVYDTTLTYLWSTGATTPYAQVSPSASSTYTVTATSGFGCSNTAEVSVVVANGSSQTLYDTICAGSGGYGLNGFNLSAAQTARAGDTVCVKTLSQGACSTTVTLRLHRKAPATATIYAAICQGECYYLNGMELCNAGTYVQHLTAANGCDSTLTLHLNVNNPAHQSITATTCGSYEWHGQSYTESGIYTHTHEDTHGCMQVDTLHLTINKPVHHSYTEVACESFEWNGQTYTESGTYTYAHEDAHGCMQVDTLHLTINKPVHHSYTEVACGSYEWHGQSYTASGTYTYAHEDAHGCQQVDTLHLTINAVDTVRFNETVCQGEPYTGHGFNISADSTMIPHTIVGMRHATSLQTGCDSCTILTLTVVAPVTGQFNASACGSYTWNGSTYSASGDYQQTLTNHNGCDSTVTLHLTINHPSHQAVTETACGSYEWHGQNYTESGTYTYAHEDANGCMQVDTLHLTINKPVHQSYTEVACESFEWNGQTYTESGTYTYAHEDAHGCMQVDTLHLTINAVDTVRFNETVCQGEPYTGHGFNISADSTMIPHTIVGMRHATSLQTGCDSCTILTLTVVAPVTGQFNASACGSYTWNGSTYSASGDYQQTLTNHNGCDSTVTLHLTINHPSHQAVTETACESYEWTDGNGQTYTVSGTYTYVHTGANGCEQVDTLHLTINHPSPQSFTETACESHEWHGQTYTASGTYTYNHEDANGCTQVDTLHLTINNPVHQSHTEVACESYEWTDGNGQTYTVSGTYTYVHTGANGCEQVDTLHLTINNPDTVRFNETVCQGEPYSGHGFNIPADSTMTPHVIVETVCTPSLQSGCDSCTLLSLTILPTYIFDFEDEVCEGEAYNGHGFHLNANQTLGSNELSLSQTYTSTLGCDSTVNVLLRVVDTDLEIISLTEDFCESGSVELSAITTLQNFVWNTGELTRNITVNQPGTYVVTASTNHCEVSREFTVVPCAANMYLPNAITPTNADGINDYFCIDPYTQQSLLDFEIIIYDRWGEEVFHSTDKDFKWHGEVNGRINANIMYVYMIKCTIVNDGFYIFRGTVTVL